MIGRTAKTRFVAFIAAMSALSNVLAFFVISTGIVTLHLIQLPIIFAGLAAGSLGGGLAGFFGAFVMASTLTKPNPYIIVGNAILGFLTGLFYSRMKTFSRRTILTQMASLLSACAFQLPYVYVTDVYLMGMPHAVAVGIIGVLLIENLISTLISHVILYRVDVSRLLVG